MQYITSTINWVLQDKMVYPKRRGTWQRSMGKFAASSPGYSRSHSYDQLWAVSPTHNGKIIEAYGNMDIANQRILDVNQRTGEIFSSKAVVSALRFFWDDNEIGNLHQKSLSLKKQRAPWLFRFLFRKPPIYAAVDILGMESPENGLVGFWLEIQDGSKKWHP